MQHVLFLAATIRRLNTIIRIEGLSMTKMYKVKILLVIVLAIILLVGCNTGTSNDDIGSALDDSEKCSQCINDAEEIILTRFEEDTNSGILLEYTLKEIAIDEEETERQLARLIDSELAESRGWSTPFLRESFLIVRAEYYTDYDGAKCPYNDGDRTEYMFMTYSESLGKWEYADGEIR